MYIRHTGTLRPLTLSYPNMSIHTHPSLTGHQASEDNDLYLISVCRAPKNF
jgi:hypothetical protein